MAQGDFHAHLPSRLSQMRFNELCCRAGWHKSQVVFAQFASSPEELVKESEGQSHVEAKSALRFRRTRTRTPRVFCSGAARAAKLGDLPGRLCGHDAASQLYRKAHRHTSVQSGLSRAKGNAHAGLDTRHALSASTRPGELGTAT